MHTLLAGAHVFDSNQRLWTHPSDVLLVDDRISRVTLSREKGIGQGIAVDATIDCVGKFLLPGIIDLHTHVTLEANLHHGIHFSYQETDYLSQLRAVQNLAVAAQYGVCLVRDLGGSPRALSAVRELIRSDELCLPELITSGSPICVDNGHGSSFGQTLSSNSNLADFMSAHRADGHEWVKIMNGPETWHLSRLSELCDAAHDNDLRVAVHAFRDDACWNAIEAGADTVEHCLVASQAMIDAAAARGTHFVATALAAKSSLAAAFARTQHPQELGYLREWANYLEERRVTHLNSGIPALIGTDGGCAPCHMSDIVGELMELQSWGYAASDLLAWCTHTAARVVRRAHELGQIASGYLASIIVLDTDPVVDLSSLYQPFAVYIRGRPVRNAFGGAYA